MSRRVRLFDLPLLSIVVLAVPGYSHAQGYQATPLEPDTTYSVSAKGKLPRGLTSVLVKFDADALASYTGDVAGLAATSPKATGASRLDLNAPSSQAYLRHFSQKQQDFVAACRASIPGAIVTNSLPVIFGGVSMVVPEESVEALAKLPGVKAVYPDELLQIHTDSSPSFIGAPTVWNALGGREKAGEGVVVGVLDTGIWPEHPSYSDPDPFGKPYPAPPASWTGTTCEFGSAVPGDVPFTCNNKLIGADRFMATYDAVIGLLPNEFRSARDDNGHGTHTSSTAAGNSRVEAEIFGVPRGRVSGIAPRAHVVMYKVLGNLGGFSSDIVAAVEQAILDGVNVINFSISGGANPFSDAVELAFLDAYNAGIFVAASAGNAGPGANTTDHRGPWVATVAASTQKRAFANTISLTADGGASLSIEGTSITDGVFTPSDLFVPLANELCTTPLAPTTATGKIVVCRRGTNARVNKGFNALQGGAAGMILYNQSAAVTDVETDNHYLPASHIQFADGTALLAFIAANTNVKGTLTAGEASQAQGDVMASFSSRGGPGLTGVSKPDVTAPGVQILAGHSPLSADPDTGPQGELFQAIAGTSMSSPHVAGAAALIKDLHPDWTPGQIKSALMTTARTRGVVKEDGVTPATPFDDGSGRINLRKAGWPGITFDATGAEYLAFQGNLLLANYPSLYVPLMPGKVTVPRTAHSVLGRRSWWELDVKAPSDLKIDVPDRIFLPAGGDKTFDIRIDASRVPLGEVRHATIELESHKHGRAHIPVTIVRKQAPVTFGKTCDPATFNKGETTDCTITLTNTTFFDAAVHVSDRLPEELRLQTVTGATRLSSRRLAFTGILQGAEPPDVHIAEASFTGYFPLSGSPISLFGDDTVVNFTVPAFTYASQTYTRLGVTSNGTVIVGGATSGAEATPVNQNLPNATPPNNVLAPFWTDLNPPASGAGNGVRVALLASGPGGCVINDCWIVADWRNVKEFSSTKKDSFQVWIGINGDATPGEDISFAYGTIEGNGDGSTLTVGAENSFGNRGENYYFDGTFDNTANGAGTLPTSNRNDLIITTDPPVPGETKVISFTAKGVEKGKWRNCAEMTADSFFGTSTACFSGEVKGGHRRDDDCDDDHHHHGKR